MEAGRRNVRNDVAVRASPTVGIGAVRGKLVFEVTNYGELIVKRPDILLGQRGSLACHEVAGRAIHLPLRGGKTPGNCHGQVIGEVWIGNNSRAKAELATSHFQTIVDPIGVGVGEQRIAAGIGGRVVDSVAGFSGVQEAVIIVVGIDCVVYAVAVSVGIGHREGNCLSADFVFEIDGLDAAADVGCGGGSGTKHLVGGIVRIAVYKHGHELDRLICSRRNAKSGEAELHFHAVDGGAVWRRGIRPCGPDVGDEGTRSHISSSSITGIITNTS